MYTGPTPMPVRGGPHTTSLIDDLTWRSRQDSNLRGETPLDFKSNALTTRPRMLIALIGIPWATAFVRHGM